MDKLSRSDQPDRAGKSPSALGARAAPVRSDGLHNERHLVAERYILHRRSGSIREIPIEPASETPGGSDELTPETGASPQPETRLIAGRYLLGPRIGSGRFGLIYHAEDVSIAERAPSRHVAVQLLWKELSDHDWLVERFQREFHRLRSWRHDNIAAVLDFGRDGDQFFWATELLDGASLRSIVRELGPDRLEDSEIRGVILGIGRALQYAHARKKVHGAVTLENVFITADFSVKLLDFVAIPIIGSTPLRVDDLESERLRVRTSDDVYGLAGVAYELFSGARPYGGSLPDEARAAGLRLQYIENLSRRDRKALSRGLSLEPEARTATVGEFLTELGITGKEHLTAEATPAEPIGHDRASREGKLLPQAAALVACAGLAYIGYGSFLHEAETPGSAEAHQAQGSALSETGPASAQDTQASAIPTEPAWDARPPIGESGPTESEPHTESTLPTTESTASVPGIDLADETFDDVPPVAARTAADIERETISAAEPVPPARDSFEFAQTHVTISEGSGPAVLDIRRVGSMSGERNLIWWSTSDTAHAEEDFADFGAVIETFADGEQRRSIHIPLVEDAVAEPMERFSVTLRFNSTSDEQAIAQAEIVVLDDD